MAKVKSQSPETSPINNKEKLTLRKRIRKIIAIVAIAATIPASVGATVEANKSKSTDNVHRSDNPTELPHGYSVDVSAGLRDVLPGDGSVPMPAVEVDITKHEISSVATTHVEQNPPTHTNTNVENYEFTGQPVVWNEDFGVNSEIKSRGPEAIEAAVDNVAKWLAEGKEVTGVEIIAFAPDDSNKRLKNNNPGLNEDDKLNDDLADMRVQAGKKWFVNKLRQKLGIEKAKSIEDVITLKDGKEIHDKELNREIFEMAESLNMETDDMVMRFNRGENLPPEAIKLLKRLAADRCVLLRFEVSEKIKIEEPSDPTITTEITYESRGKVYKLVIVPLAAIAAILEGKDKITPPPPETPRTNFPIPQDDDRKFDTYHAEVPISLNLPRPFSESQGAGRRYEKGKSNMERDRGGSRGGRHESRKSDKHSGQGHRGKKAFTR
jgi:hypothetical protein